ncbi:PucR family transcriptional regulator ligand-binding domain-containing protein [Saccharomonospora sp. NPDC006951]
MTSTSAVSVRTLLDNEVIRDATVVAGDRGLERMVSRFNVMSVPHVVKLVKPADFLLVTGYPMPRDGDGIAALLRELDGAGIAAVGVKFDQWLPSLPTQAAETADELGMPLLVVPETTAFGDVLSKGIALVSGHAEGTEGLHVRHTRMLDVVLRGQGLADVVTELADVLGGAVALCDETGLLLAGSPGAATELAALSLLDDTARLRGSPSARAGDGWLSHPVEDGGGVLGRLLFAGDTGAPHLPFLLAHAAQVAALQLTRERDIVAVQRRFATTVLHALLRGGANEVEEAAGWARRFSWDVARPVAVVLARPPSGGQHLVRRAERAWTASAGRVDGTAACGAFDGELVAVLGEAEDRVLEAADELRTAITHATHASFAVGVSRKGEGPAALPQLYRQARVALDRAASLGDGGGIAAIDNLGVFRLFGQLPRPELDTFVTDLLSPVLSLPEAERADMVHTLRVFLRSHGNVAESARALHLHYNTLRYRIGKLEKLLGPFGSDPDLALDLAVALQIHSVMSRRG